jgi:hypothetical protein
LVVPRSIPTILLIVLLHTYYFGNLPGQAGR